MTDRTVVIEGEERTRQVGILVLRSALKLECKGMKRRGRSAYAITKEKFGFKGSKQRVLEQLNEYIEKNILPTQCPNCGDKLDEAGGCTTCGDDTHLREPS